MNKTESESHSRTNSELQKFTKEEFAVFKRSLVDQNRGKPLFLMRFARIQGCDLDSFIQLISETIKNSKILSGVAFSFYAYGDLIDLAFGVAPRSIYEVDFSMNFDAILGKLHDQTLKEGRIKFDFGIGRTQSNHISLVDEIFRELELSSRKNLKDNLVRWSWTYLNRVNDYFAQEKADAVIQPIIYYDRKKRTFNMKGGEVFVGGDSYAGYGDLIRDIPMDQDLNRIELLILEKLIHSCSESPGLLKFNMSPQTLIDTFDTSEKVARFHELLIRSGLEPHRIRIELVEKPYEETDTMLKDACTMFWQYGISFAADDFGVKSQSHQVVLDLGEMIKEFKLDPISFKFKAEQDMTKFLDNLAFIDYCKRLSDNREAIITAEALEDLDTLNFLLTHQIYYFQTNLFCKKISIQEYKEVYSDMQDLPEDVVTEILNSSELTSDLMVEGNMFRLAKQRKLY